MIGNRHAHGATKNHDLKSVPSKKDEGNVAWLERVGARHGLVLLGGSSLGDFRVRVAQSHVRGDFKPSFWSQAGILEGGRLLTVPLEAIGGAEKVVSHNGVVTVPWRAFDDADTYPNVAVLQFAAPASPANIAAVRTDRGIVDVPTLMARWLGYLWGAEQANNPLLAQSGVPSAAFVESVYMLERLDLTPGLSPGASCPEAIWQSAKWWRQFYEGAAPPTGGREAAPGPRGSYVIRQAAAAVRD